MRRSVGPWRLVSRRLRFKPFANQGMATVTNREGRTSLLYRGDWSVPRRLKADGWDHIGDPDSRDGHVFDAYQASKAPATSGKLFEVTTPAGSRSQYRHTLDTTLDPVEMSNNSFVAISPDGQWMVSGEWQTVDRLLVFPTPLLNAGMTPSPDDLRIATTIHLSSPVCNVQGGAFLDDTTIVCSTNDPGCTTEDPESGTTRPLWPVPRQLLELRLARPLDGQPVEADVRCLGELPTPKWGWGAAEVEGIDYDSSRGSLRVDVVPRAPWNALVTTIYEYRR